jgi:hypothetical protein
MGECQKRSSTIYIVMNKLPSHPPIFIFTPSQRSTLICIYHPDLIPPSYIIDYMTYYCFRMPVFLLLLAFGTMLLVTMIRKRERANHTSYSFQSYAHPSLHDPRSLHRLSWVSAQASVLPRLRPIYSWKCSGQVGKVAHDANLESEVQLGLEPNSLRGKIARTNRENKRSGFRYECPRAGWSSLSKTTFS